MKKTMFIIALALGFAVTLGAQSKITNDRLEQNGDFVRVTFDVETEDNSIPKNRKEVIMPYLYNGKDTLYLDPLEVYGKNRFKRERQEYHIAGDKDWELGENQIMRGEGYRYEAQAGLKRWMKPAQLGIRREMVGCACEEELSDENLGQFTFQEPQLPPRKLPEFLLADVERKLDLGQDDLQIIFKVSKAVIDSSVFENEMTFGKILAAIDKIQTDPRYRIEKIQVSGYASPEGSVSFNKWLGENRAKALIDYIISQRPEYELTMDDFEIVNGEENWSGLRKVLVDSDMDSKDEVIAIIDDSRLTNDQKKLRIKAMNAGKVWNDMLKKIYPHLRSARYLSIYYDSVEDQTVETINNANALLREGRYRPAYDLIMTVKDDDRAFNTIGVALMMQAKFEEAMPWFEKALKAGYTSAQANIDGINAEYQHEQELREELEERLKKYE